MEFFVAVVIVLFLLALHYQFLQGKSLLEPVATPSPTFDRLFNKYPLLFSMGAGLIFAVAFLLRERPEAFYPLLVIAITLLLADWVGCSVSLIRHLRKDKRR
jgi:uncharacterized membrane protein YfcA